ncbi:MAG: M6 family metalloprotease domain-containing protein [Bacteroidales bacterium]|nr:M6 family metalloprotease domain-containing protein [Bacteroidales bacterium]
MKNLLFSICLWLAAVSLTAVPALRTVMTLTQPDGTTIQVLPYGDEYAHYLTDALTGELLICDEATGFWRPMTDQEVTEASENWSSARRAALADGRHKLGGTPTSGDVPLPVLLVEFPDRRFSEQYGSLAHYDSILNSDSYRELIYTTSAGKKYYARSARNYFRTQSSDVFRPKFDIIGPVLLDSSYTYYGQNDRSGNDMNWSKMVREALTKAVNQDLITQVSQWDGDDDKHVDLLYIIYAGWPESERLEDVNAIWPKNATTSAFKAPDGTYFAKVSMSSELMWATKYSYDDVNLKDDGIGTLVHEFCHALGLPDFYDTRYTYTCYGMDAWSVLDLGCYSGRTHIPECMTVHERMFLGWMEPDPFPTTDTIITLAPISTSNKGYILRNPANSDEYLTFENHQHDGNWDEAWGTAGFTSIASDSGLLITHVDYKASNWISNTVNLDANHQLCTPLCADGTRWAQPKFKTQEEYNSWRFSFQSDIYPGKSQVTTLNNSNPLTIWFTGDSMQINITDIEQLANGDLRITIGNPSTDAIQTVQADPVRNNNSRRIRMQNGHLFIKDFDLLGRKFDIKL